MEMCLLKAFFRLKDLPQLEQSYDFSLVCVLTWDFNDAENVNTCEQVLQTYGFSPVCILICFLWSAGATDENLHNPHL